MPKKPEKRGRGRPSLGSTSTTYIGFKADASDVERWKAAAEAAGLDWPAWLRDACERQAKRKPKR